MLIKRFGVVLALCFSLHPADGKTNESTITVGYVEFLVKAYGFCMGQTLTAERIQREVPEFEWPMKRAMLLFENGTHKACDTTASVLRDILNENFQVLTDGMEGQIKDLMQDQPLSRQLASEFVAEVERRARWEIDSPMREALLSVAYKDAPEAELVDGHVQKFSTVDHPKSLGIDATIRMPLSWKASEGERPHIIQKWRSQGGFGMSSVMLMADDTDGMAITLPMLEEMTGDVDPLGYERSGGVFRGANVFTHETLPAISYHYDLPIQRAGLTILSRVTLHQIFFPDRSVSLMCQTGGLPDQKAAIDAEFEAMEPLCRLALNSLVLNDVYR